MIPINFPQWVNDNQHLLKPPVNNLCLYNGTDFIVMAIGGPNNRNDYHINETEEWFYQVKGEMSLHVVIEQGDSVEFQEIKLKQGDMYLLPRNTPHNPVRYKDSIGLVMERVRTPKNTDKLRWYCKQCKHIVYEEAFQCSDLATQLKEISSSTTTTEMNNDILDIVLVLTPIIVISTYYIFFRNNTAIQAPPIQEPLPDQQLQQHPPTRSSPPPSHAAPSHAQLPKTIGKKKARNLDKKSQRKNYIEGMVVMQAEKERKRLEMQRLQDLKSQRNMVLKQKQQQHEQKTITSSKVEENQVYVPVDSVATEIQTYLQTHFITDINELAQQLRCAPTELIAYISGLVDNNDVSGYLDMDLDQFVYLDPSRIDQLNSNLVEKGIMSRSEITQVLNFTIDTGVKDHMQTSP